MPTESPTIVPTAAKCSRVLPITLSCLLFAATVAAVWGWLLVNTLGGELANETAEVKTLQDLQEDTANKLSSSNSLLAAARDNLIGAQGRGNELENQLVKTSQALAERSRVPFSIKTRSALIGSGLVAFFTNASPRTLTVIAEFTNPTLNKSIQKQLIVNPQQTVAIGYAQGWAFASGDKIKLTSDGYEPLEVTVP